MSYTSLSYHIVFSTKGRKPFLSEDLMPRIVSYVGGIIRQLKGRLLEGGGADDHVHLAAVAHPTVAVADLVGKVKANSTGWIHKTFADLKGFGWQDGYAGFSVSPSVLPKVTEYIRGQGDHHRKMTFQEELIALLRKHGVEYDEGYIWA